MKSRGKFNKRVAREGERNSGIGLKLQAQLLHEHISQLSVELLPLTPRRGKSNQIKNLVSSLFTRGCCQGRFRRALGKGKGGGKT